MTNMTDKTREIAIPLPAIPGQKGRPILRLRGDADGPKEMTLGLVLPMEHGKAIPPGADIISMTSGAGQSHLDVKTIYESPDSIEGTGWKPLSVSSEEFGDNWDRIFGKKDDQLLN